MAHPYRSERGPAAAPRPSALQRALDALRWPWALPLLLGVLPLSLPLPWSFSATNVVTGWERVRSNGELVLPAIVAGLMAVVGDRVGTKAQRWPARVVAEVVSAVATFCYFVLATFPVTFTLFEPFVIGGGLWLAAAACALALVRAAALAGHAVATPFRIRRLRIASFDLGSASEPRVRTDEEPAGADRDDDDLRADRNEHLRSERSGA